jgi:hypothetical protein
VAAFGQRGGDAVREPQARRRLLGGDPQVLVGAAAAALGPCPRADRRQRGQCLPAALFGLAAATGGLCGGLGLGAGTAQLTPGADGRVLDAADGHRLRPQLPVVVPSRDSPRRTPNVSR